MHVNIFPYTLLYIHTLPECVYRYIFVYTNMHIKKEFYCTEYILGQKSVLLAARIMLLESLCQLSLIEEELLLPDNVTIFLLTPNLIRRGKQN